MKSRPILFSGPMVRAILEGRKTQTRRVVKPPKGIVSLYRPFPQEPENVQGVDEDGLIGWYAKPETCPYGKPGDRLWVRETWQYGIHALSAKRDEDGPFVYAADNPEQQRIEPKWRPSIHMPRWASRITLKITGVRVERLQDISAADAIAEGLKSITKDGALVKYGIPDTDGLPGTDDHGWPWHEWRISPVDAYQKLWESINGPGSWNANPWVWVVEFKRLP